MEKKHGFKLSENSDIVRKLDAQIQERVNSGYDMPIGWLFKNLTLYFNHQSTEEADKINNLMDQECHLGSASNTARFAGAVVVKTLDNPSITHVVVDPKCSAAELSSIRKTLASAKRGNKVPHLVTVTWVEESWEQRTLLGEERMSTAVGSHKWVVLISFGAGFQPR